MADHETSSEPGRTTGRWQTSPVPATTVPRPHSTGECELPSSELEVQALLSEEAILRYLAQLPDSLEELRQQREVILRDRITAKADAYKYDRIGAQCTTREALKRNARRAGNSLLMVRTADEKLEAIRRKREALESGCPCGSCAKPCFLTPAFCLEHGRSCTGHEPDITVDGETV